MTRSRHPDPTRAGWQLHPRILVLLTGLCFGPALFGQGGVPGRISFAVPRSSFMLLSAADFDGEGRVELALVDPDANRVALYRMGSNGGFDLLSSVADDQVSFALAVVSGDTDGDGRWDLLVAGPRGRLVFYGAEGEGLEEPVPLNLPSNVRGLTLAHLNDDELLDVAAVGGGSAMDVGPTDATVLFNRGGRVFSVVELRLPISFPHVVLGGDYNGDGHGDLFVWGRFKFPPYLAVLEGRGEGRFEEPVVVQFPSPGLRDAEGIAGDLDGDARDEVALFLKAPPSGDGRGSLFTLEYEQGAYTLREEPSVQATERLPRLRSGDFDGDGQADGLVLAGDARNVLSILLNASTGGAARFQDPRELFLAASATDAAAADFDGDRTLDVAVVFPGDGLVEIILSPLELTGGSHPCFDRQRSDVPAPDLAAVGDFSGTGRPEAVVCGGGEGRIVSLGAGRLEERAVFPTPAAVKGLATGDVDGDGRDDVVLTDFSRGTVEVLLSDDAGRPGPAERFPVGLLPAGVTAGDFAGDRALDLAVSLSGEGRVAVLEGRGGGEFLAPRTYDAGPRPEDIASGDLDGDGLADLVVVNAGGAQASILSGIDAGGFAAPVAVPVVADPQRVEVSDLDGNGLDDIVVASRDTTGLAVYLSFEDSRRLRVLTVPRGARTAGLALADLDGDGRKDIAVSNSERRTLTLIAGKGGGEFEEGASWSLGPTGGARGRLALAAGDLDRDGLEDLVVADAAAEEILVYRSLGCAEIAFRRGDADLDGRATVSDAIVVLMHLFLNGDPLRCEDAADADDDGELNITDPVIVLRHLFLGGPPPASPGPDNCGEDIADDALTVCEYDCR